MIALGYDDPTTALRDRDGRAWLGRSLSLRFSPGRVYGQGESSPSSDIEQFVAIPQAHPWFPPSQTRIIVFLGLDPRNHECKSRTQFP